jgi:hypothetical protein
MKNKYILLLPAAFVALITMGADDQNNGSETVVVGSRYDISNGTTDIKGTILFDSGGGWYKLIRDGDGFIVSININSAFLISKLNGTTLLENTDRTASPFSGNVSIGVSSWDPRWSNYGVYLLRLVESIQAQWEHVLNQGGVLTSPGSMVEVKFALNSKGEISKVINVNPSAGTSLPATQACPTAIQAQKSYGEWTDDMNSTLGTEQEFTFVFYYAST